MVDDTLTAHHEAAHAVITYRTTGVSPDASLVRDEDSAGHVLHDTSTVNRDDNREHMMARILSNYAGGHAQRRIDPTSRDDGCASDDEMATRLLWQFEWEDREQELRDRSAALVDEHWVEIVAVAKELLRVRVLDGTEVETVADIARGDATDNDLSLYRALRDGRL